MRLSVAALALLALPAGAGLGVPAARAQDNPMKVIIYNTAPAARPAPRPQRAYRARKRYEAPKPAPVMIPVPELLPDGTPNPDYRPGAMMPAPEQPGATPAAPPAQPVVPEEKRPVVVLVGDSLAEALGYGFGADEAFRNEFTLRQKTVSASGLVRDDYQDWPKALPGLLGASPPASALVVMLGLNDRQLLTLNGQSLPPLGDGWREAYGKRIDAVIAAAKAARVPLVWVGLPAMRAPQLSTDLAQINTMIRDRVNGAGETFVEIYDAFADAGGGFSTTGPDIIGDTVRLRGPDGIHFTPAGQRKLAFFVDKPLRRLMEASLRPQASPATPASTAPASTAPANTPAATAPVPAARPVIPARIRPEVGEARPLASTPSAATLAGSAAPHQDPVPEALFSQGQSPEPRPGRADDYRWK